jgi:DNA-directed RNA polymerase specialized sigma24 family protein
MTGEPAPRSTPGGPATLLRRNEDVRLVAALALEGFDPQGRRWLRLAHTLIDYGYGVLEGKLAVPGEINRMARTLNVRGLGKLPPDLWLEGDRATELATIVLTRAVPKYHQTLASHAWNPDGGASLASFFIGRCLLELPDAYQHWRRQTRPAAPDGSLSIGAPTDPDNAGAASGRDEIAEDRLVAAAPGPADEALARAGAAEILRRLPTETREMLLLRADGYTMAEIAEQLSADGRHYTATTVRSRLHRARRKLQAAAQAAGAEP